MGSPLWSRLSKTHKCNIAPLGLALAFSEYFFCSKSIHYLKITLKLPWNYLEITLLMFIFLIRCDSNICISADLVCDGTFIKRSDFFWKLALILMPRFLSWVEPYYFLQFNLCQRTPQSLWNNFSNLFQLPKKYDLLKQFSVIFSKNLLQVQQIPFLSNRTKLAQIFLSLQESAIVVMVRMRVPATIAQVSVIVLVFVRLWAAHWGL